MAPPPACNYSTRYVAYSKLETGIWSYFKEFTVDRAVKRFPITSRYYINKLSQMSREISNGLQRLSHMKLSEVELLFYEDFHRNLWFMGSRKCFGNPSKPLRKPLRRTITQNASFHKKTESYMQMSFSTKIKSTSQLSKTRCPGQFCNLFLISKSNALDSEENYEILLEKMKNPEGNRTLNQMQQMKLEISTDQLFETLSKLNTRKLNSVVPYKYILLVKQLLQKYPGLSHGKKQVEFSELSSQFKELRLSIKQELKAYSAQFPQLYYSAIEVCQKCYSTYSVLFNKPKSRPHTRSHLPGPESSTNLSSLLTQIQERIHELQYKQRLVKPSVKSTPPQPTSLSFQDFEPFQLHKLTSKLFPELRPPSAVPKPNSHNKWNS